MGGHLEWLCWVANRWFGINHLEQAPSGVSSLLEGHPDRTERLHRLKTGERAEAQGCQPNSVQVGARDERNCQCQDRQRAKIGKQQRKRTRETPDLRLPHLNQLELAVQLLESRSAQRLRAQGEQVLKTLNVVHQASL